MDHIRDFDQFKRMVMRVCVTFDKFASEDLIEAWWKALRDQEFKRVLSAVDAFIAQATDKTKFPRPAQFRSDAYVTDADRAQNDRYLKDSRRNWDEFIARYPTTGPIRFKMAHAAQIMARTHESDAGYAEAQFEYLALEKQLGESGRFSVDR